MPLFKGLFTKPVPPPWPTTLSPRDYGRVCEIVGHELFKRTIEAQVDPVNGVVNYVNGNNLAGLANLCQRCSLSHNQEWPAIVSEFFDFLDDPTMGQGLGLDVSRVRVRLFPLDMGVGLAELVTFDLCGAFVTALVEDLPKAVRTVRPDEVEDSGMTKDELFDKGLENIGHFDVPEHQWVKLETGTDLLMLHGDSFMTASHIFMLERYFLDPLTLGVIVGVPHRHVLFACEASKERTPKDLAQLAHMALGLYTEGPGSITPDLVWWHNGHFKTLEDLKCVL